MVDGSTLTEGENFGLAFFVAPEDGYALTYVEANGGAGNYFVLSNGSAVDGSDSTFGQTALDTYDSNGNKIGGAMRGVLSQDVLKAMMGDALDLNCDVGLWYCREGRGSNSNLNEQTLTFVAKKLPTVDKTISSIKGEGENAPTKDVSDGVALGDTITFDITMTRWDTNHDDGYGQIYYYPDAVHLCQAAECPHPHRLRLFRPLQHKVRQA